MALKDAVENLITYLYRDTDIQNLSEQGEWQEEIWNKIFFFFK